MNDKKCAVCGDPLNSEHPEVTYQENPLTFRKAWMHHDCFDDALDQISRQDASSPEYLDRRDEYILRFE